MAYKSYKHLSNIKVSLDFSTKIYEWPGEKESLQIKEILLMPAHCAEQGNNLSTLQEAIANKVPVRVEKYENFIILRAGSTDHIGTLYIDGEESEKLMKEDLKESNGILGYWDTNCVGFVVAKKLPLLAKNLKHFLENLSSAEIYHMKPELFQNIDGLILK